MKPPSRMTTGVDGVASLAMSQVDAVVRRNGSGYTPTGVAPRPWKVDFVRWCYLESTGFDIYAALGDAVFWAPLLSLAGVEAGWEVTEREAGDIIIVRLAKGVPVNVGICIGPTSMVEGDTSPTSAGPQSGGGMVCLTAQPLSPHKCVILRPPVQRGVG